MSELITLKQLCAQLKIHPRVARIKLRKSKFAEGMGARWEFTPSQAAQVKALLKGDGEKVAAPKAKAPAKKPSAKRAPKPEPIAESQAAA
jgi:hypothetical protein